MLRRRLDQLEPGMRVVEPVLTPQSVLLIKPGTVLTQKNIQTLKAWGVPGVTVEGDANPVGTGHEPGSEAAAAAVDKKLSRRFSDVLDDPVMAEIMRVASLRLQRRLAERTAEDA